MVKGVLERSERLMLFNYSASVRYEELESGSDDKKLEAWDALEAWLRTAGIDADRLKYYTFLFVSVGLTVGSIRRVDDSMCKQRGITDMSDIRKIMEAIFSRKVARWLADSGIAHAKVARYVRHGRFAASACLRVCPLALRPARFVSYHSCVSLTSAQVRCFISVHLMQHHLLTASYHDLRSCGIECTYDCFRITEHARTERRSLPHADRLRLELICSLKQLGLNDGTAITRQYSKLRHYAEQIMARGYDSPTLSQVPLFVLKSVILDPADQPVLAQLELNSIARPFGVLPTADATAEASVATVPLYCIDSWLRANPPTVQVSVALTPRKPGTQNSAVPPLKLRQLRLSDSNPAPLTWPRHAKEHRIRPAGVHTAAQAHPTVIGVRVFVGGRGGPGLGGLRTLVHGGVCGACAQIQSMTRVNLAL